MPMKHDLKSKIFILRFGLLGLLVFAFLLGVTFLIKPTSPPEAQRGDSSEEMVRDAPPPTTLRFEGLSEPEESPESKILLRRRSVGLVETGFNKVGVDVSGLASGDRFEFALFDHTTFIGIIGRREQLGPERAVFFGSLEDIPGDFVLAYNQGAIAADFSTPGRGNFRIRPLPGGGQVAEKWDPSKLPPCEVAHEVKPNPLSPQSLADNRVRTELHRLISQSAETPPTEGSVYNGSGQQGGSAEGLVFTEIDILVVHTANARAALGGVAGMGALIDLALARANSVFINSDVGIRLRLVRVEEVAYTEIDGNRDLYNLQQGNLALASVATWRNESGADLVSFFTTGGEGRAFLYTGSPNSEEFGYSVTGIEGAENTFVHEIGHNLSLRHDRENDPTVSPLYSYSHGWRFTPANSPELRTVMAYAPGNQIPYFSNPDVTYMGTATGVDIGESLESNNAQALENTKSAIAAFRGAPGNTPPVVSFDSPGYSDQFLALDDVTLTATASDVEGAVTEVRFYRLMSDSWFQFANTASTTLGTDSSAPFALTETEAPAGFWTYAVAAFDGSGAYGFDSISVDIAPHYRRSTYALPSGKLWAEIEAIHPDGRFVGYGHNGNKTATDVQAATWENGVVQTLPPLAGDTGARATSIDVAGVIYGESISVGGVLRAVSWDNGVASDLSGIIAGFTAETVIGVDEDGKIYLADGNSYRRFDDPGTTDSSLNERWVQVGTNGDYVTGQDYDFGVSAWQALRWRNGGVLLPQLAGYASSWGQATNRSGAVIGLSSPVPNSSSSSTARPTFWAAGSTTPVDVGTFGDYGGVGYGLNDFNHGVGTANDPDDSSQAFIWKGQGDLINLNRVTLPEDGILCSARVINNRGQIAGTGLIAGTGFEGTDQIVFFLDPLPGLDHKYWLGRYFSPSELENASLTDDGASPSGDGVPNLLKRSAGLDPRRSVLDFPEDAGVLPRFETDAQGHVTYTFRRLRVPGDLNYEALATLDLTANPWLSDLFEVIDVTSLSNDMEEVTIRSIQSLSELEQIFIRLKLSR